METRTETNQTPSLTFAVTPDLRRWAEAFMTAKRAEGLARRTIAIYGQHLRPFLEWSERRNVSAVEAVTPDDLRAFMLWLADGGHNAGGQHVFFRVLKTWLRWYEAEVEPAGWRNPIAKLKPPKLPDTPLEPADLQNAERMLNAAGSGRMAERDRAIVLTLLDTGLRASELTALDLADLDAATGALLVRHGKGGKARTVFLGQKARRAVRAWLRERGGAPVAALFTNESGGRLSYFGLREIVRRLAVRAGVPVPPLHAFRRAFALNFLRNGGDLLSLQRMMGHADITLLRRYAKQNVDDLRAVHAGVSPVDQAGL